MPRPTLPTCTTIHPAFTHSSTFTPSTHHHFSLHTNHPPNLHSHPPSQPPPASNCRLLQPRPQLAWLSHNSSHNAQVVLLAYTSSPHILQIRGPPSLVLNFARFISATVVYAHARNSCANRSVPLFLAANIQLKLVSAPSHVLHPSNSLPCTLALASASAPILIETRNDTVTRFVKGNNGLLQERKDVDQRPLVDRLVAWLTRVYLPVGFPHTTTPDYISFTKYRTLQNLASAVMSVISTEALLFGLGLGKKVAAGAAATSWVLKDGASYIAKIWYGSVYGSKFDDDPKSWRIAADIVEDIGGAIEILTPLFPMSFFLPLASLAVCLRGCSLMTGTATRHVVYRSLAASGMQNTGDIATKGESQGVTMKMLGLGTGILVSSKIGQNYYALLAAYTALAAVHIVANWRSVQCVQFSFFNKQRAAILIESHLDGKSLPSPYDVSHHERIILPPWKGFEPSVRIGGRVSDAVASSKQLEDTIRLFRREKFLIFTGNNGSKVRVLMRDKGTSMDALRAYYTVKKFLRSEDRSEDDLIESYNFMRKNIRLFERMAKGAGWDTKHMLLTEEKTMVSW